MREDTMYGVEMMTREFTELLSFIRTCYPTYIDGVGDKHFVAGPATADLREAAKNLVTELNDLRFQTAKPLPPFYTRDN